MNGYTADLQNLTKKNSDFRHVLYTGQNLQLVLMALKPGEDIGLEIHKTHDQFFHIEKGRGEIVINGTTRRVKGGHAIIVPAGVPHNLINTGAKPMQLYTLYSPPNHRDGLVQKRKSEADASDETFKGVTTEISGAH
jgi:mannose-6-phosphate isomerase-like protein (cupin superfamily)